MKTSLLLSFPLLWKCCCLAVAGAIRAGADTLTVTSTGDAGPGSLRQAILDAAAAAGPDTIVFSPAVFAGAAPATNTISVLSPMGVSGLDNTLTIDARDIPGGVTLRANGVNYSLLRVGARATVSLHGLTFTGCHITSSAAGAIYNYDRGKLTLTHCTLHGNSNDDFMGAGAIFNIESNLTLTHCTLYGNTSSGPYGSGAISTSGNFSTLTMEHCTLFNNSPGLLVGYGATLTHCTLAGDTINNFGSVTVRNCIAGTLYKAGVGSFGYYTLTGVNLVNNVAPESGFEANGTTILVGNPQLAPPGDYGGLTLTMPPLPGSLAIDPPAAETSSGFSGDQRGLARLVDGDGDGIARVDLGAYEAGNFSNYNAWSRETLPAAASAAQRDPAFDFDSDGQDNSTEWLALTSPGDGKSFFLPVTTASGSDLVITFPTAGGRTYRLRESNSPAAGAWSNAAGQPLLTGNGAPGIFTVPQTGISRRFYQVVPALP